ncbi:NosD domain-containing protein, partial [Nanoarchaeota archaeon]
MIPITKSRKAALVSLAIVLGSLLILATTAFLLSGQGNEISGMATLSGCGSATTGSGTYDISGLTNCGVDAILIKHSNVILDCGGSKISGDGTPGLKGIWIHGDTGSPSIISNIVIRDCVIEDFQWGVMVGDFLYTVNAEQADFVNISGNEFNDNYYAIAWSAGDDGLVEKNSFDGNYYSFYGGISPFDSFRISITQNQFSSSTDRDVFINTELHNTKLWLNSFTQIVTNSDATQDFCVDETDGIIRDEMPNYWTVTKLTTGCDEGEELDAPYLGGNLPVRCGAEVLGDLTLSENLQAWGGTTVCPDLGLSVSADGFASDLLTIDCNGNSIQGSDISYGVRILNQDYTEVMNCDIVDFRDGIKSGFILDSWTQYDSDHQWYHDNTLSSNTRAGINLESDNNDINITDNQFFDNYNGLQTNESYGVESDLLIKDNLFQGQSNVDYYTSNTDQPAEIYGNTFYKGVFAFSGWSSGHDFCVNNIGNEYHVDDIDNLPTEEDCGSAYINDSSVCSSGLTYLHVKDNYLETNVICASTSAFFLGHNDQSLDCQGNFIYDSSPVSDTGVIIGAGISQTSVVNCNISNFNQGIDVRANSIENNLSNNILENTNSDINFDPSANYSDVYGNTFLGLGITNHEDKYYCFNGIGNFYASHILSFVIDPNDCGYPDFDEPSFNNSFWTETQGPIISWSAQDSALPVEKYHIGVRHYNNTVPGWYYFGETLTTNIEYSPLSWHPP